MSFSMKVYASKHKPRIVLHPHAPIDKTAVNHILQALSPGGLHPPTPLVPPIVIKWARCARPSWNGGG